jgi:hypothetical protein
MSAARHAQAHRALIALVSIACWMSAQPGSAQESEPQTPEQRQSRTFEVAPRGYIQLDARSYPDWPVAPGTGRLEYHTFEVRRLRAGLDGHWRWVGFEVTVDPQDIDGTLVKDAYAQLRLTPAIRVRAGQFKVPGGREYQTSARNLDFLERAALASSLAAGRDLGVMVTGDLTKTVKYQAGVFAGDGNGRRARAGLTSAGRIVVGSGKAIELGASFSIGRTSSSEQDPANGAEGRTASGYRFFEPVYVQGQRLRIDADARWEVGAWRLSTEVLRARDARDEQGQAFENLPAVSGIGWSAAVRRRFGRRPGALRSRIREWEAGLRIDGLSFDDDGAPTAADSVRPRAADIRARSAQTLTGSLSWGPTRWARVITNVAVERYDEPRSAPEAGRREPYWTFGTRLQLELP